MNVFLKKYWFNLLTVFILTLLLLYIIPHQEKSYLSTDLDAIKEMSHRIFLWTELVLFVVVFVLAVRKLKNFTEFLNVVLGISFYALIFFFLFDSIFLSAALFLNKLSKSETGDKKYRVIYVDNDKKDLMLWDEKVEKTIEADQLLSANSNLQINANDTINVSFKKGLLGFNYDPELRVK